MAYKPILFNTEMVQAIQAGRKTQTRRVCKGYGDCNPLQVGYHPPFNPGDILWVRETWCENKNPNSQNFGGYEYRADYEGALCQDLITWRPSIHMSKEAARIFLRVKDVRVERLQDITEEQAEQEGCAGWHIEITGGPWGVEDDPDEGTAVDDFQRVWDTTIKPADRDKYGWDANPWVWVIEFEPCEKPQGW